MPDFQSLIERVEKASGPDRELGNDCLFACGWVCEEHRNGPDSYLTWAPDADSEDMMDGDQPDPTASLDAVMALKQDGHTFALGDCNEDSVPWACVTSTFGTDSAATGSDVILAALAAILKSRLAERGSHE